MDDQLLKNYVERQFGKRITDRPDCEDLSQQIFSKTHLFISYNTLRRFFRLAGNNESNPSNTTLNILSIYCGYRSYDEFMRIALNNDPVLVAHDLLLSLYDEEKLTIDYLKSELEKLRDQRILFGVIPSIIQRAFYLKKIELIKRLFELDVLFDNKHYLHADLYFLMQLIGEELRNQPALRQEIWKTWATIPHARFYYFELFVDMDHLIDSHFNAIKFYLDRSDTNQDRLFAISLLYWKALWTKNTVDIEYFDSQLRGIKLQLDFHPIPIARALNCIMVQEFRAKKELSAELTTTIEKFRMHFLNQPEPFFHFWIVEGMALTQQLKQCLLLIEELEENWNLKSHQYFHGGANEKLKILKLYCYTKLENHKDAQRIKAQIDPSLCYSFSRSYDLLFHPEYITFKQLSQLTMTTYKEFIKQLHGGVN
jgi:hypothetical protein